MGGRAFVVNTHAPQPPTVCSHCDPGSSSPCRARRDQCYCSQIMLAVKLIYTGLNTSFPRFTPPLRALLAPSRARPRARRPELLAQPRAHEAARHAVDSCRRVACGPHALRVLLPEAADRPRRGVARLRRGAAVAAAPRRAREPPSTSRFSRLRATRRAAARCERAAAPMGGLRRLAARSTREAGAIGASPRWPRRRQLSASPRPLGRLAVAAASEGHAGRLPPVPPPAAEARRAPPTGVGLDASGAAADAAAG